MTLKVLELFGGIGACTKALERLGIPHEVVDYVEIDKHAVKSFNAIHNTNFEPQDITTWDKDIKCDLIMHGSPCQDFSLAGKQAGGDKGSGTRSSLMYETLRIVEKLQPKYVIWENVKNLLSKKHIHNYKAYVDEMERLGYGSATWVLNAKDCGIPQNRERVFTLSVRNGKAYTNPNFKALPLKPLGCFLEIYVDKKYFLDQRKIDMISKWRCYEKPLDHIKDEFDLMGTITTRSGAECGGMKLVNIGNGIRKLTPRECWRLMGFDDIDYEKASKVCSEAQLYKQAGNSIVVNVLEVILKGLLCKN